jgi:uncharacterized repeat protein (TIGR01451 family)
MEYGHAIHHPTTTRPRGRRPRRRRGPPGPPRPHPRRGEDGGGTVQVTNSTFTGNGAIDGGAIDSGFGAGLSGGGTVTVTGSTFTGNTATGNTAFGNTALGNGGAIDSGDNNGTGTVQVTASTFSGNTATAQGNTIDNNSGVDGLGTPVSGTVQVAGDLFDGSCAQGGGTWTDGGYNAGTDNSCFGSPTPPAIDTSDPAVGSDLQPALTDNGGPTQTVAPTAGNPAIALITNPAIITLGGIQVTLCPATDQRGYASATGANCDAGAVQTTPSPADLSLANTPAPDPVVSGQPLTYTLTATNTGGKDATAVTVTDPLPASAVFGSMSATRGTCQRTVTAPNKNKDGTVTCHLGTLPGGATATVTITVTPTTKGTLTNPEPASVTATNVAADRDDSATATVTVHGD